MAKKIILVHGLGGTNTESWGMFPELLRQDNELDFEVISLGYVSPPVLSKEFYKRGPSILNIANGLLTEIRIRCDLENDEIILAGHSLGGLVVKTLLLKMADIQTKHKITKVCFFDVPHDGSGFANVGKYLSFRNRHLKSLCRNSSELDGLNDQWVDKGFDKTFIVLSVIADNDDRVSSASAKSIYRYQEVITINNVNHETINKPESIDSTAYVVFKKFLLEKVTVNKYKSVSSRELHEWKSMERQHGYQYASDENRTNSLKGLASALESKQAIVRLTGASGLGKTRLILEALEASDSLDETSVLIFNAPNFERDIEVDIRKMVDANVFGLVVVENCSVELHNKLTKEIQRTSNSLKLVSVGYSGEPVKDSIEIQLHPLADAAIKEILTPILRSLGPDDVDRVARFAQGYPLMATLIADQYIKEGRLLGSIEDKTIVKRLIEGDGEISKEEMDVLSACSLFDVFGTTGAGGAEEAKFIAEEVAGSTLKVFDRVLRIFTSRQIINRAGRYARVVPKPIALTLASDWWAEASVERQEKLIGSLPKSLEESFGTQASYLDSQPNVQKFSEVLFGPLSPFGEAEELLTERGSKLFRAFTEVNPDSTSTALYRVLAKLSHEQLYAIDGDTRRNLVWGLEKLCFHADVFEKSAWCMLLLASSENEDWSNNATGQFSQLFRVQLSGTQALPHIRFELLKRAMQYERLDFDLIVLKALGESISTHGGTRTAGAEYQGTRATLKEWEPKLWQDIFDFWQLAFDLLLVLFTRGDEQKEKVLAVIGHSIRGLIAQGRIEMLDVAIKNIVALNGPYWPAALDGIKCTFEYDSQALSPEATIALQSWLELLSPNNANLEDRLRILVVNPPWEHRKDANDQYVDVAGENAETLAVSVSLNIDDLLPHLPLLLQGDQKQAYVFGNRLALELNNTKSLLKLTFEKLVEIDRPNLSFLLGIFRGIFSQSPVLWQENINNLLADEKLTRYYPDFIRTGDIQKAHLDTLMDLIRLKTVEPAAAIGLSYGSVTDTIEPEVIAQFCLQLSKLGEQASWVALNVMYMYCFGKKGSIEKLREPIKYLILGVPLHKGQHHTAIDVHHWRELTEKLIPFRDEQFAVSLANQLVATTKIGLNHGDIWSHTKPLLMKLMKEYYEAIWPLFGNAIVIAQGMERYWLQQLLDRETGVASILPSVFSVMPVEYVIDWCTQQPEIGPVFVASCLNVFETTEEAQRPTTLLISLLEHFGSDPRVMNTLSANTVSRGWSGSLVPYLEADKAALSVLLDHKNNNVREWVKTHIASIDRQIKSETISDDERNIGFH